MNGTKTMAWTAALALLVGAAAPAAGQGLTAEVRGGPSFPAGDLAEVTDVGFNGGIGLGLWSLGERLTLRADGDYEMLNQDRRGNVTMPRTHLWHYQAGLELGLTDAASAWLIRVRAGAGGTTYDTNRFQDGSPGVLTSAFSVSGGLSVGRAWVGPMEMGILGRVFVAFLDRDRTARLAEQNPTLVSNFSKSSSVPVALYLRWRGMTP
jgi:hypothetical protein